VLALEWTAPGDFDRNLHRSTVAGLALMKVCAECSVTQLFHGPPD
jgi:hypothetical protein